MEEKIKKELLKDEKIKEVFVGEYINVFRKVGDNKTINKSLNLKPDFITSRIPNGVDYVFVMNSIFDIFKVLNKILIFKISGILLECSNLIFFITENELVYLTETKSFINEKSEVRANDLIVPIEKLATEFSKRIDKRIIINLIE